MNKQYGFTVIELLVVLIFTITATAVFISQTGTTRSIHRDTVRKTAINAMHYSLEEAYFKQKNHYPQKIDSTVLPTVDPSLFTDISGVEINNPKAEYQYQGIGCSADGKCKGYKLSAKLETEAEYIKVNR